MDFHAMEMSFPIDEQTAHWRFKPGEYLADIIGHEGPGSLHSYLKERGWITTLSTGVQDIARGIATFKITFYLSQNGFRESTLGSYHSHPIDELSKENHREVAMAAFKYMSMLRSTDLSPTHQSEVSSLSDIRFRFAEKRRPDDYAVWVADKLSWPVPRELVIKAPQVVFEWDPDGTAQAVAFQTLKGFSVNNSRTLVMAKQGEFQKLFGTQEWQSEPWYGTQYRVERLEDAFIQEVRHFPLRAQGLRISFSHRQKAQIRSMLFIFLDQTSSFLSDWTSTGGRFHKYASTRLKPLRPV
jgi:insulysin